jgi:hypothetical protein
MLPFLMLSGLHKQINILWNNRWERLKPDEDGDEDEEGNDDTENHDDKDCNDGDNDDDDRDINVNDRPY